MSYCCAEMDRAINDYKKIEYDLVFRDYLLDIDAKTVMRLKYCPWCGMKFPKFLTKEFFMILEEEYAIDLPDLDHFTNVPPEFRTDEWWKKRGL